MIVAVPVLMAVTNPEAETVAIAGLLDVQVIVRPVMVVPPFLVVAVSWTVGVVARLSVGAPASDLNARHRENDLDRRRVGLRLRRRDHLG